MEIHKTHLRSLQCFLTATVENIDQTVTFFFRTAPLSHSRTLLDVTDGAIKMTSPMLNFDKAWIFCIRFE